jgi:hypothetical protein
LVEAYSRTPGTGCEPTIELRFEINDASAVGAEPLDRLLRGENRSENVEVVVEVKTLFGNLREGAEAEYPGVVDQNVQSPERRIHFFE